MKTDIDKNIKKDKNIKMDKNMQAENIHKNVDEITINDFVAKNDKDVLELKKHVLSSGSVVPLLHFRKLNELSMIEHCFTTRLGGLSEGMFESLNLSFTRGDDEEKVLENYKKSDGGNRSRDRTDCYDRPDTYYQCFESWKKAVWHRGDKKETIYRCGRTYHE